MKKFLTTILFYLLALLSYAHDEMVDGIYYNLNNDTKEAVVTYKYESLYNAGYSGSVTIPSSITTYKGVTYAVTSIGYFAFSNCHELTEVSIPNSVISIGISAFSMCYDLTEMTVPNSVTSIGSSAFFGCSGLRNVTIGSSVNRIYENAFAKCKNLKTVTCLAEDVPHTETDAFRDTNVNNSTLFVPEASLQAYKTATPWSEFGTILPIGDPTKVDAHIADAKDIIWYDLSGREADNVSKGVMINNGKKYVRR